MDGWLLVRELGLEYVVAEGERIPLELEWPVAAEPMPDGGMLVVDEWPIASVPPRADCRTLRLSPRGEVRFHSKAAGVDNGHGCVLDDGGFAIVSRTRRELTLHEGESGAIQARIDLSGISPHRPRIACGTPRGTFMVSFLRPGPAYEVVEIDRRGALVQRASNGGAVPGNALSLQALADGGVLAANETEHVVEEYRFDGAPVVRWGVRGQPSAQPGHLFLPKWARALGDGTLLVADSHNHRCLARDAQGCVTEIVPQGRSLSIASSIAALRGGGWRVCDAGQRCVLELDRAGRVTRQLGEAPARLRSLSFPRSVQSIGAGRYRVADTAHDRVVDWDGERFVTCRSATPLSWPRAAWRTARGTTLVADGRNARVLELAADGTVLRELSTLRNAAHSFALEDPHEVRELANGNLLVADSSAHRVCECDWDGNVAWIAGPVDGVALNDPHCAQPLPDGRVLIADSGNHRILVLDPKGGAGESIAEVAGFDRPRLNFPRYAEAGRDGSIVIVDSHHNRVIALGPRRERLWELTGVPGSPLPRLFYPRWAQRLHGDELLVSDHFHHRIVHLRRVGAA